MPRAFGGLILIFWVCSCKRVLTMKSHASGVYGFLVDWSCHMSYKDAIKRKINN